MGDSQQKPASAEAFLANATKQKLKQRPALACTICNNPYPSIIEDYANGDYVCADCGLVLGGRIIDPHTEWRTFSNDKEPHKDQSRVGSSYDPYLSTEADLSTRISKGGSEYGNLSRLQNKNVGASDKVLTAAFKEITSISEKMHLPQTIRDRAKQMYRKVCDNKEIKARSNQNGVVSACVYVACRQEQVSRTLKEVCAHTSSSKKEIGRCYRIIAKLIDTKLSTITTGEFMDRFCSRLDLKINVRQEAAYIAAEAKKLGVCGGKTPISVAAGAIYMASQLMDAQRTPHEIGQIAGVTEQTVRLAYRDLYNNKEQLLRTPEHKTKWLVNM